MSLYWALILTRWLTGIAILLQSLELLEVERKVRAFWPWRILRREYPAILRPGLSLVLGDRNFFLLIWARVLGSLLLLFHSNGLLLLFLLVSSYLVNLRWRGTYNGGSDVMTFLLLGSLTVAEFFSSSPKIVSACLWYVALQSILSYFVAGWVKLAKPSWRSGEALKQFLKLHRVKLKVGVQAAWAIMLFEAAFPIILVIPSLTIPILIAAFIFHLLNAYLLGLNRFVFVWLATYPAICFASSNLS